jgi:hypothetical protein
MGFLFDFLVPAIIIFAVLFIWLRALLVRYIPPRPGSAADGRLNPTPHPRSFSQSGGLEGGPGGRQVVSQEGRPAVRSFQGEQRRQPQEPSPQGLREASQNTRRGMQMRPPSTSAGSGRRGPQANRIRQALESRQSVQTAFMLKEVLDRPVSARSKRVPGRGR